MTHLSDDDLVLHYYGEDGVTPGARDHVAACGPCRDRLAALERALSAIAAAPVPERGDSYGREVWDRIRPQLDTPEPVSLRRWWWSGHLFTWPRLALAGGLAALLIAAFVAGRVWQSPPPGPATASAALQGQERILLVAVGHHLERSARMLVELTNLNGGATVNISMEQEQAADLIAANRLYRQAAVRAGENGLASVLDDLERVLVEVTNSPATLSAADVSDLRQRLDDTGLLFKVRVTESQVQQRQRATVMPLRQGSRS